MSDNGHHIVELPDRDPDPHFSPEQLVFSADEKKKIDDYKSQYATAEGAVMKALWLAQEKFGFLPPEVIKLVAGELDIPYALAYGVATFYTQYYKKPVGKYVLDVCTCYACQVCGGYDILHHIESKLGVKKGGTTRDGTFTLQEVECLGACGSGPMLQISNSRYVHNLTPAKVDQLIQDLRKGQVPSFCSVTLPQDEDEMGGNRRTDVSNKATYSVQPVSDTLE